MVETGGTRNLKFIIRGTMVRLCSGVQSLPFPFSPLYSYPCEAHLVHYREIYGSPLNATQYRDGLAVLGSVCTISPLDNPNLSSLLIGLAKIIKPGEGEFRLKRPRILKQLRFSSFYFSLCSCSFVSIYLFMCLRKYFVHNDDVPTMHEPTLEEKKNLVLFIYTEAIYKQPH